MHDEEQQQHNDEEVELAPRLHEARLGSAHGLLELLGRPTEALGGDRRAHAALNGLRVLLDLLCLESDRHPVLERQ